MKNKKTIIALSLIAIIGIVGLTIAYFANSTDVENTFTTKEYGTTYTESFVSPENWLPGDTTEKSVVATNTGQIDQAVRIKVEESWITNNDDELNGWIHADGTKLADDEQPVETDERVAILNLANADDWTKVGNYYYYNYKLAPTESTSSFLESVTFNSKTKLDDTCATTTNNGVTTTTCNSSGDDYDNATYTLTLTIETVQYNKYATAWNTNVDISTNSRPIIVNGFSINPSSKTYETGNTHEMFIFNHEATEQTEALTDYRYIGSDPYNYVYFNCSDLNNQSSSTCEVWRIIGLFDVDDGTGNYEKRLKIVRGSLFNNKTKWNSNTNVNDWITSDLQSYLNGSYYNSLKTNAKEMISESVFYLGSSSNYYTIYTYGTAEDMYTWERGTTISSISTYCAKPINAALGKCRENYCTDNPDSDYCTYPRSISWIGKIALLYPSDIYFNYAYGVEENCYINGNRCSSDYNNHPTNGWIYNSNKLLNSSKSENTWVLSADGESMYDAHLMFSDGAFVTYHCSGDNYYTNIYARPTLYLSSSVKIIDGDGSSGNPYKLSL